MRNVVGVAAALAVALLLPAAVVAGTAAPAGATVSDVDAGGQISRQLIVERALTWVDSAVPYSQSAYFPPSAPRTGVGHSYRQDCSGFLSMAWDLPGSAITSDFVSTTSAYDVRLASWDELRSGDMLGVPGHVVVFLGWSSADHAQHRYFDMVSEATSGTTASVQHGQDRYGYWRPYLPYRYRHVVEDAPQSLAWGTNGTQQLTVDAAGHVIQRYTSNGATWTSADLTAAHGFATVRPGLAVASSAAGTMDVLGIGTGGGIVDLHYQPGAWTQQVWANPHRLAGLSAASGRGRIDVVARMHGADAAGMLVAGNLVGGHWSGVAAVPSSTVVDDPAVVRSGSVLLVAAEGPGGSLMLGRFGGTWSWSAPFGAIRVTVRPALAALADGTLVVAVDGASVLQQATRPPGSTVWSGFRAVSGVPPVGSLPAWSSAGALPTANASAPLDLWSRTAAGTVVRARRSTAGAWSYYGTSAPPPTIAPGRVAPRTLRSS